VILTWKATVLVKNGSSCLSEGISMFLKMSNTKFLHKVALGVETSRKMHIPDTHNFCEKGILYINPYIPIN
jgi:hypothetical protein